MQQQVDSGTSFTTKRTRAVVVAVITTLLVVVVFQPWRLNFDDYPVFQTIFLILAAICLRHAVRGWYRVLRGRSELQMTPADLTMTYRGRQLTIPWSEVADIRIEGKPKTPWVVARLSPAVDRAAVPVRRRRDGSYKLFPIAHGQPSKERLQTRERLRSAIMGCGRRYLEPDQRVA
ncbi:hypothetical protein [Kribbella kalugense]|uniref:PH (Pleckstrin Homology) domain-containing protein n=1 Tax=Kribbella kalugense TaxID=2512221 RepID=A0A4R7ZLE0_9ACTN|nr:hypothetical protein [Kribbella kalugense]TDW18613.1 hypothetical protein EV650_5206 [Kribbella kalugense]